MTSGVLERHRNGEDKKSESTTKEDDSHAEEEKQQDGLSATPTSNELPKDLQGALDLLGKEDDTIRFVGLGLLKSILEDELSVDNDTDDEKKAAMIEKCWDAMPISFIDRLLKSRKTSKRDRSEINNMIALGVSVLHVFMTLLKSPGTDEKFLGRIPLLRTIALLCPRATRDQILSIFHAIALKSEGSFALFRQDNKDEATEKPESYLFVTMLVIDIRTSLPYLEDKLHQGEYPTVSQRLSRAYDLISAFIVFLVHNSESVAEHDARPPSILPSDLLIKIRTNVSEALSLTMEHLRDRFDVAVSAEATNLPINWDRSNSLLDGALITSQLGCLSFWLREDDNNILREEAVGIMDVLLSLYQYQDLQPFQHFVLTALQGILQNPVGIESFLDWNGWLPLGEHLTNILTEPTISKHDLGIDIIRILLMTAESDIAEASFQLEWMAIIDLALKTLTSSTPAPDLELAIAVCQLAVELLVQAPPEVRVKHRLSKQMLLTAAQAQLAKSEVGGGDRDGLQEVMDGLEGLEL